ncbi:acyl-CoA thioesterase [Paraurantiacibacter namhicola]|uniref:Acyl-CoA thioesterase 2 n=1 Tax=Paraurantiacibacter namhicola TaxID=645517 RepID=A0A1C7D7I8_9SPHN|nr:acyl-CoA thioesterase II [Paraurantiacibacter namhicola]ANU07444.1 Acyl-CoA thioesterase 2 [Paraurantiacibacter namhicola]
MSKDTPTAESAPTGEQLVADLLRLLTLERIGEDSFLGPQKPDGVGRIFGGQVVAQALVAAEHTVPDGRAPHSLHASFLRGGDEDHPVDYRVERLLEGRSFSHRRVTATQPGGTILTANISFQRHEEAPSHQAADMPDVPPPEDLMAEHVLIERMREQLADKIPAAFLNPRPIEQRSENLSAFISTQASEPKQNVWARTRAALPDDPAIHRAVLAYYTDYRLMSTGTMPHDFSFLQGGMVAASLDHQIWFHDPAPKVDDWLLYAMTSPISGNARCLNHGQLFTREGRLVASTAQEGMFRERKRG